VSDVRPGFFVTLEGGEGAGKSTLARRLAAALAADGRDVVATREPGGTPGADAVRALLVAGEAERWSPLAETLLFAAARADHLERIIRPALARGAIVVCDRYVDSTFAYQVAGRGLPVAAFDQIHSALAADAPDLTFVLDLDPLTGLARSRGAALGEDRYEGFEAAFHARVRAAFLDRARAAPARTIVLDACLDGDALFAQARACMRERRG